MLSSQIWPQSELRHSRSVLHGICTVVTTLCIHSLHCRRGSVKYTYTHVHFTLKLSVPLVLLGPYQPQQGKAW